MTNGHCYPLVQYFTFGNVQIPTMVKLISIVFNRDYIFIETLISHSAPFFLQKIDYSYSSRSTLTFGNVYVCTKQVQADPPLLATCVRLHFHSNSHFSFCLLFLAKEHLDQASLNSNIWRRRRGEEEATSLLCTTTTIATTHTHTHSHIPLWEELIGGTEGTEMCKVSL